ncbi:phosphotransferase [Actinoplanes sp. TFC3]|uniref:phosphotransferase n=1 Tax=Actinoplanes sp. TFC3 TaxID=1710355 RepID=UPI0008370129|nr:phosphotransferase [Actinoplanes sp. TFC3]
MPGAFCGWALGLVRSRPGNVTEQINGKQWRAYEWLTSGPPLAAPVAAVVTREVGALLATIHALGVPANRLCPWSSLRLPATGWPELSEAAAGKGAGWAPELAAAVPTLTGLAALSDAPVPAEPVLCHNNLTPGNVRVGAGGCLVVTGWEHASGLPPVWELCAALVNWTVEPGGDVNGPAVRALLDGYGEPPQLTLGSFRGTATALQNYVAGQVEVALGSTDDYADRSVHHLLTHLPTLATYEQILQHARA